MRSRGPVALALLSVLVALLLVSALARAPPASAGRSEPTPISPATAGTLTASVGGTHLIGVGGHAAVYFNATGGPAYAANGSRIGNLTYYASLAGPNTTGATLNPDQDAIFNGSAPVSMVTVGPVAETLTINVMFSSVYQTHNESLNLSFTIHVVEPYVLSATIVDVSHASVLGFPLLVYLDGSPVGNVSIGTLSSNQPYHFTFDYLTLGLGAGWHTFSLSLASEHGLVLFSGGSTSFSESFYVPGPPPDYTIWYIVGVVAFVGTIFILLTRVAARRRGAARK